MKYLVTGAAGFIGSHLVEALLDEGKSVVGLDNLTTGKKDNLKSVFEHPHGDRFQFIHGDIRNDDTCLQACKDVSVIFHLAASTSNPESIELPDLYFDNNVSGTLNLLLSAKQAGVKRLVFSSSAAIYAENSKPIRETDEINPSTPYALGKYQGEQYCQLFNTLYGVETVILRYFNVYGPKQDPSSDYSGVLSKFIQAVTQQSQPVIYGDGEQTRDFIGVDDVIQANLLAAHCSKEGCGKSFNIGTGDAISINQILDHIQVVTDKKITAKYEPERKGDLKNSCASIQVAQDILGFHPKTQMSDVLKEMVQEQFEEQANEVL